MSFVESFSIIADPRSEINLRHDLLDILFLAATAVMSGAEGWKDIKDFGEEKIDWLRQYRDFNHGIPADDTIARIISALDSEQFTLCFVSWVNELRSKDGREQIAIDGKTLRRSFTGDRTTALHSITAWSKQNGLVLAQKRSKGKANEKASVLEMLDLLELKGAIVTADAMNTEKKIAKKICDKGGDYVLCVKNNHKNLLSEIKDYFHIMERDHRDIWSQNYFEEVDAGHGRIETRTCRQIAISPWIEGSSEWQGLQTVVEVTRKREIKESISREIQYYISSLPLEPKQIANAIRGHWAVENKAHWVLDVTYKEDESRIRRDNAAENLALLRRFAFNLARLNPQKNSMKGKLKKAMWSDKFRSELLDGQIQSKV